MADWAEGLPRELLCLIFRRLALGDGIRCSVVCTNWRATLATEKGRARAEPPWLAMLPRSKQDEGEGVCRFYSIREKRVYKVPLPQQPGQQCDRFRWRRCIGSSEGWLVVVDDSSELHMVNPFTGAEIQLPSVTTLPGVAPVRDLAEQLSHYRMDDMVDIDIDIFIDWHFARAAVSWSSSSPPASSAPRSYTVVVIYGFNSKLALAKGGDTSWTTLTARTPEPFYCDITFHKGQLYAVNRLGHVDRVDLDRPPSYQSAVVTAHDLYPQREDHRLRGHRYLTESADGELLQVIRWMRRYGDPYLLEITKWAPDHKTTRCQVFKLDEDRDDRVGGGSKWVPMRSLGGQALFLGYNAPMSIPPSGIPEEGEGIYFADYTWDAWVVVSTLLQEVCMYSLEDRKIKPYYPHKLHRSWPRPNWIRPNLI